MLLVEDFVEILVELISGRFEGIKMHEEAFNALIFLKVSKIY